MCIEKSTSFAISLNAIEKYLTETGNAIQVCAAYNGLKITVYL